MCSRLLLVTCQAEPERGVQLRLSLEAMPPLISRALVLAVDRQHPVVTPEASRNKVKARDFHPNRATIVDYGLMNLGNL